MKLGAAAAGIACMLAANPWTAASADEVWRTQNDGLIVYDADIGTTAVFSAQTEKSGRIAVYVPGLGGVWGQRRKQSYDGYFVGMDESGPCEAALQAVDERTSHTWGDARIVLTERGFPTTVLLLLSPCGGSDEELVVGKPVIGGER